MLTLEEAGLPLTFLKVFSILNLLPIEVDVESGKIGRQSNRAKVFISRILVGVGVCQLLYVFGRLVQSTILEPQKYFRWDHFVLHLGFAGFYAALYFTRFRLFIKTPEENEMIFNHLFSEREDPVQKMMDQSRQLQMKSESEHGHGKGKRVPQDEIQAQNEVTVNRSDVCPRPRPLSTWPPQYSLDELLAKLIPSVTVSSGTFMILVSVIDPSRPQLLYSVLPPEYQNVWSFLILLAVEVLCMAIVIFTVTFSVSMQVLFFGKCQLEFKRINLQLRNLQQNFQNCLLEIGIEIGGRDIRAEIWILHQILKEMQELIVFIELFNRCFPVCIFAWKIFSISTCIIYYFFAIRHHEDFPLLAGFMGYAATTVTLVYTIMYRDAFSIPGKIDELKNEFFLTVQKITKASTSNVNGNVNVNKTLRADMKREIKRIRSAGVKVGTFHQMERESTPRFVDFVLRNVVNLLVTFPQ